MSQRLLGRDTHLRPQLQHATQQVEPERVDLGENQAQVLCGVDVGIGLVFGELGDARPGTLRGRSHQAEDFLELVFVGCAGEEGSAGVHFGHDAASGPDVDAGIVGAAAEEDVGSAVPEGDDLVGEGVDWDAEGAGEPEVG